MTAYTDFLRTWGQPRPVDRPGPLTDMPVEALKHNVMSRLVRPLPNPPRRRSRPHEMQPALYLGGIGDVSPVSRLRVILKRDSSLRLCPSSPPALQASTDDTDTVRTTHAASMGEGSSDHHGYSQAPHDLWLLVCACACPPAVPQARLELRCLQSLPSSVSKPNPAAARQSLHAKKPSAPSGTSISTSSSMRVAGRNPGISTTSGEAAHSARPARSGLDILHKQWTLTSITAKFLGGGARTTETGDSAAYGLRHQAVADELWRWMSDAVEEAGSRSASLPAKEGAEAAQSSAVDEDGLPCVGGADGNRQRHRWWYWKLSLPLLDTPQASLAQYLPITTLLLHAVLTAPPQPTPTSRLGGDASEATVVQPCAVVHCMAGRSRSASLVSAFYLRLWLQLPASREVVQGVLPHPSSEAYEESLTALAQRLVNVTTRTMQRVRLCVCPNDGFREQLCQDAEEQLRALGGGRAGK